MLQSDFEEVFDPAAFEVVHIDTDNISAAALHAHWDVHNPTFPVLTGCGSLLNSYGDGYIPYNTILDTQGIVRYTDSGFNESAMLSIIQQYMAMPYPVLSIQSLTVTSDDNMDGRPDGGEMVDYALSLRNSSIGTMATSVTVSLATSDPTISITSPTVTFAGIAPGTVVGGNAPFEFNVAEGIQPHWTTFTLTCTAIHAGGTQVSSLQHVQRVGRPNLLVVDSDGTGDDNETFMISALNTLAIPFDTWSGPNNPLAAAEMARYPRIFWLGGINHSDVTDAEEAGLRSFMDVGGQLLLSSQYMSDNPARADFLAEYFDVIVTNPNGGTIFIVDGLVGDPWFGGTAMVLSGSQGANNNQQPDLLSATPPATIFGRWRQAGNAPAAVYTVHPNYAAMYCGFPIEANRVYGSVAGSMNMRTFLEHALPFFDAYAHLGPLPPANLAIGIQDGNAVLNWTPASGADGYNIYSANTADGPFTLLGTSSESAFTDTGIQGEVMRFYQVVSVFD